MPDRALLLIPSVDAGAGTGHLVRCLRLLPRLGPRSRILVPPEAPAAARIPVPPGLSVSSLEGAWDLIVLDRRSTSAAELARFLAHGPVAALDEGGKARKLVPFLIDTLPLPADRSLPNVGDSGFLDLPVPLERNVRRFDRVLLSFGGEDPAGLTEKLARWLVRRRFFRPEQLTAVIGPLFRKQNLPEGVAVRTGIERLPDILPEYDLLFTSFGLTAYEGAASGLPVILFDPSPYHRMLSRLAGFPGIGVRRPSAASLRRYLADPAATLRRCGRVQGTAPGERRDLAGFLTSLSVPASAACPACGAVPGRAVARFHDRSYFRCSACGMIYLLSFSGTRRTYGKEYFFEEYRTQYGRTYLEDFETIRTACRPRTAAIRGLLSRPQAADGRSRDDDAPDSPHRPAVLDIGCAFGPFLAAARDAGMNPFGIDLASDAVRWVRSNLNLPAAVTDALSFDPMKTFGRARFDAVSLWFVIEHLPDIAALLRTANALLPVGGVLAFSTPNGTGVSMRTNRKRFLFRSPPDHRTIWTPAVARSVLRRYGFTVRRIRMTGHHPERFPIVGGAAAGTSQAARTLRGAVDAASRLFALGDTFEVYAVKTKEWER